MMPLVEVVKSIATSPETIEAGTAFVRRLGKEPIAARDSAGFIVNLLLIPYLLDAVRAVERGVASIRDVDTGDDASAADIPMGPLTLLDFVGLDTAGTWAKSCLRNSVSRATPRRRCSSGWYSRDGMGKKSGRGSTTGAPRRRRR